MVLLYTSTIAAFITFAVLTIKDQPWIKQGYINYTFSFQQGYASVPDAPEPCQLLEVPTSSSLYFEFPPDTKYAAYLTCGDHNSVEQNPLFLLYYNYTGKLINSLYYDKNTGVRAGGTIQGPYEGTFLTDSGVADLKQSGILNNLSLKRSQVYTYGGIWSTVLEILRTIFVPLIGFFLVRSIVYPCLLYLCRGIAYVVSYIVHGSENEN